MVLRNSRGSVGSRARHTMKKPAASHARRVTKRGKVVSRRPSKWALAVSEARKALGLRTFVPIGGKTVEGQRLYAETKKRYGGETAEERACKQQCMFESARDQFKSCLNDSQEKTVAHLAELAKAAQRAGKEGRGDQQNATNALEEAKLQLRLLADGIRSVQARVVEGGMRLQEQAQAQQKAMMDQEQRYKELEEKLATLKPSQVQVRDSLAQVLDARSHQNQRIAEFLHSNGEASLKKLLQVQLNDVPNVFKVIEEQRQAQLTTFMSELFEAETTRLAFIQERCQHSVKQNAWAMQELKAKYEEAKNLAEDFVSNVRGSCDQMVAIAAHNEARRAEEIECSLTTAQSNHEAALHAESVEWCGHVLKAAEAIEENHVLLHGEMKKYLPYPMEPDGEPPCAVV